MSPAHAFIRPDRPAPPLAIDHVAPARARSSGLPAAWLVLGGVTVAVLDMLCAMAYWARDGVTPEHVLQSVAVWFAGPSAFAGGLGTAASGSLLYVLVMCGVVALYYAMARPWSLLLRRPLLCGGIYGALAYLAIFQLVVPLLTGTRTHDPMWIATCIVVFTTLVGMPCALFARAAASASYARAQHDRKRLRDAAP